MIPSSTPSVRRALFLCFLDKKDAFLSNNEVDQNDPLFTASDMDSNLYNCDNSMIEKKGKVSKGF